VFSLDSRRATIPAEAMNPARYRFGLFEFDSTTGELRREGALLHLQSQPARVLSCLISRAGQVVSREELRQAIWGTETFVDFERGLNFCIAQIRSALDDDSATPRYIRTLPRRGYQLIAPVERLAPLSAGEEKSPAKQNVSHRATSFVLAAAVLLVLFVALAYRLRSAHPSNRLPIVAVLRFDNETGDSTMTRFSDGVTDTLVEQLASSNQGRFAVIGNAAILRLPREQRDLSAISSSLHAGYVILGQVQSSGTQTRVLAHLIRLPDQTHLWVVRIDRPLSDLLAAQAETAQKISAEFSPRLIQDSSGTPLPPAPNH
jgi:DNA-binding winged helix-turn-helix (wHTH) protein/TolB-like protein